MDHYLTDNESFRTSEFQRLDVSPSNPEGKHVLEEKISPAGHRLESDRLIGEICQKQFNRQSQESDNAAIVYERGSMKGRASLQTPAGTQKIVSYIDVLTSDMKLWRKWVQNDCKQTESEVAQDRAISRNEAYWSIVKDNFADLVKKLHELSHHST